MIDTLLLKPAEIEMSGQIPAIPPWRSWLRLAFLAMKNTFISAKSGWLSKNFPLRSPVSRAEQLQKNKATAQPPLDLFQKRGS